MNVLLISQCDKRALTETRRILDQFAERRGDRTWQTPITQDGLDTLRRLLRKTARKNTAVACHWIRGLDHSELVWVVGDRSRFNPEGAVPTNTTSRDILRTQDENDWHTAQDIHLLTSLAALLHDLGKACQAFQERLRSRGTMDRNLYRHEWVSLRLFQAFVGSDDDKGWLQRLAAPTAIDDARWLDATTLQQDGLMPTAPPFPRMPPLAQAVGWLVVTHHRLPVMPSDKVGDWLGKKVRGFNIASLNHVLSSVDAGWNERCAESDPVRIKPYWLFPHGLPVTSPDWRKRASRVAGQLLTLIETPGRSHWLDNPFVMHVSRMALMLADHRYSSLEGGDAMRVKVQPGCALYANTERKTGRLNQSLDEHLVGVARFGGEICHALPRFKQHLPRLAHHKGLKKRSAVARFRWQDKAADLAGSLRAQSVDGGAFIVNMASTGCGKTLANARIMYALADPQLGMRCSFALGLRTLTLQTGLAYRQALALGEDDLAIRVGGGASRELFEHHQREAERTGSASVQELLPEDSHVHYEGQVDGHPLLGKAMHDPNIRALLMAPMLTCTIDHLTPATESQRGGRQIAPMLRLMSSDLVLDELDDFDLDDLPAVARLVHWAGMLGARVLVSSATLPPALVQGMFDAYRDGRSIHSANRGQRPGQAPTVACVWVDEFHQSAAVCADLSQFTAAHLSFAERRKSSLAAAPVRRRAELLPFSPPRGGIEKAFATEARAAAMRLHRLHGIVDRQTGKQVSFGLIRMANIAPLYEVALALYRLGAPEGVRIHLCVYHAQYPLLLRSAIEQQLDTTLDRRQRGNLDNDPVFEAPGIRTVLDHCAEPDHVFIVLGSPVTEVGRDHDYDWAVVEPSSMRSIIQLAGRVWRHRPERECTEPNVLLFDTNIKGCREGDQKAAFCQPGFESSVAPEYMLQKHRLTHNLLESERTVIDARPRIWPRDAKRLQPKASLVDLEHYRLGELMVPHATGDLRLGAYAWWRLPRADALLTAVLPQQQPFREDNEPHVELCLLPTEDDTDVGYALHYVVGQQREADLFVEIDRAKHVHVDLDGIAGPRIQSWAAPDYLAALSALAEAKGLSLTDCAKRFAKVSVPASERGWYFHPALGYAGRK
jgi:CRISPR-associated endonuclease/helicase Cas3